MSANYSSVQFKLQHQQNNRHRFSVLYTSLCTKMVASQEKKHTYKNIQEKQERKQKYAHQAITIWACLLQWKHSKVCPLLMSDKSTTR